MSKKPEMFKALFDGGLLETEATAIISAIDIGTNEAMDNVVTDESLESILAKQDAKGQKLFRLTVGVMLTATTVVILMILGDVLGWFSPLVS